MRDESDAACNYEPGPGEDGYEPPRPQKKRRGAHAKRTGTMDLGDF